MKTGRGVCVYSYYAGVLVSPLYGDGTEHNRILQQSLILRCREIHPTCGRLKKSCSCGYGLEAIFNATA